jgi:hypothetical protein
MSMKFRSGALLLLALVSTAACKPVLPDCGCQAHPDHPGCAERDYLLVEGRISLAVGLPVGVEVRGTPSYAQRYRAISTAAVRPPDECAKETASEVTGRADRTDKIASTDCGVWMAEVERTLSAAGFRVVSWDAVRGLITNRQMPPHEAARELNAQVLFLFNSAEAAIIGAGASLNKRAEFFHSDVWGHRGPPYPLPDSEGQGIQKAVAAKLADWIARNTDRDAQALSATIDATAVLTDTGEAFWFYRHSAVKQLTDSEGEAYLLVRTSDGWRFTPRRVPEASSSTPGALRLESATRAVGRYRGSSS